MKKKHKHKRHKKEGSKDGTMHEAQGTIAPWLKIHTIMKWKPFSLVKIQNTSLHEQTHPTMMNYSPYMFSLPTVEEPFVILDYSWLTKCC